MTTIKTLLMTLLLATFVLVGCNPTATPSEPPALPTATGLPATEPTIPVNAPVEGYPAPGEGESLVPTIDPANYPAPVDPGAYPAP